MKYCYVCSGIKDSQLLNKIIAASSLEEASSLYYKEFNIVPEILGPFYRAYEKKKKKDNFIKQNIVLEGKPKRAIYNNWLVNVFFLKDTENAFLIFIKRVDGKKATIPKENIISINDLKLIDGE